MPTTTNFGWTTPADTDLVKNGASAMRTLGNGIDTSFLDLKGGSTGQILTKQTATDLDFTWTSPSSLVPTLVKKTGRYYRALSSIAPSNAAVSANITFFTPFFVSASTSIDRIGIMTGSSFSGTSSVRLGIYNDSSGQPGSVVVDGGTVSCTAASTAYTVTVSTTLAAGTYWLVMNSQTAATTNSYYGIASTAATSQVLDLGQAALSGTGVPYFGYNETGVTGAFATVNTANLNPAGTIPLTYVRIA